VIAGVATAWAIEVVVPKHQHPVKTVAVVVAAKDLQLGTPFTADNIDQLTAIVEVPRSELPNNYVRSKEELLDKRLYRSARRGDLLSTTDVKGRPHVSFSGGHEIATLPIAESLRNIHLDAGCRVDLVAVFEDGDRREVFTLLPDVYVFAVNAPDTISIPVDDKLAALLNHGNLADLTYELRLRHPDSPKRGFDYEKTLARVKSLRIQAPAPHAVYALAPTPHPAKPRAKDGKK
jgi:hypothetical protein